MPCGTERPQPYRTAPLSATSREPRPRDRPTRATSVTASTGDQTFYELLGVPYTATSTELSRAYRAAMKQAHPDRHHPERRATAEEQTKRLNHAYATLSKPLARQAYDRTIRAQVVQDQIMGRYVGGFIVPQETADPAARRLRRNPTTAERREQAAADRSAVVSIVIVFGGVTLAMVALVLVWAIIGALLDAAF